MPRIASATHSTARAQGEFTGICVATAPDTFVVAVLDEFPGVGSPTPAGGDTAATLTSAPDVDPERVPVIVISTLPPTGSAVTMPLTVFPTTVTTPQAAP